MRLIRFGKNPRLPQTSFKSHRIAAIVINPSLWRRRYQMKTMTNDTATDTLFSILQCLLHPPISLSPPSMSPDFVLPWRNSCPPARVDFWPAARAKVSKQIFQVHLTFSWAFQASTTLRLHTDGNRRRRSRNKAAISIRRQAPGATMLQTNRR